MCGRFTLHLPPEMIAEIFGVPLLADIRPRFNVALRKRTIIVRRNRRRAGDGSDEVGA